MEFLTTEEIAQMLKVKVITVERWLAGGKMRGRKVGRRWLVTHEELKGFLGYKTKEVILYENA